jgi:hypothetical protein
MPLARTLLRSALDESFALKRMSTGKKGQRILTAVITASYHRRAFISDTPERLAETKKMPTHKGVGKKGSE